MDKLDRMIEAALAEEDRAIVEETQELGFFTQFTRQLAGPNAWVSWMSTVGDLRLCRPRALGGLGSSTPPPKRSCRDQVGPPRRGSASS